MRDRIPRYAGRVRLIPVDGQDGFFDLIRADEPLQEGTPLNKDNLLKDRTAEKFGLDEDATINDVFSVIGDDFNPIQPPILTIEEDILVFSYIDARAERVRLYRDGEMFTVISGVKSGDTYDLSNTELNNSIYAITATAVQSNGYESAFSNTILYVIGEVEKKLDPPNLSITNSTITFLSVDRNSEKVRLYKDGLAFTDAVGAKVGDTYSLADMGWGDGIYSISAKSISEEYGESDFSNTVIFVIGRVGSFGVLSTTESTLDGGENVVTFTDGNTLKVRNGRTGSKGDDGYSGVFFGEGTPPENATVHIVPGGDPTGAEIWEFELEDGTIIHKTVVVLGEEVV